MTLPRHVPAEMLTTPSPVPNRRLGRLETIRPLSLRHLIKLACRVQPLPLSPLCHIRQAAEIGARPQGSVSGREGGERDTGALREDAARAQGPQRERRRKRARRRLAE